MAVLAPRAPLAVYMLADHLDAALAAGEDLVVRGHDWRSLAESPPEDVAEFAAAQREVAEDVRSFELMVTARILKAREHARALITVDVRFAAVAKLFLAGTAVLIDAIEECGDSREIDFDTGDGLVAYIRGRGLIAPHAAGVSNAEQLTIDDSFLIARRVALGPLLDMTGGFLDALDTHYDLFLDEDQVSDETGKSRRRAAGVSDGDVSRLDSLSLN